MRFEVEYFWKYMPHLVIAFSLKWLFRRLAKEMNVPAELETLFTLRISFLSFHYVT